MEALAFRILQMGDIEAIAASWAIMFASAAAGIAFTRFEFRLSRSVYFLTTGLSLLISGMTSLFVLGIQDALKNGYLTAVVALVYGSLIPIGIFTGVCAAARSMSAYGTRDKWFLSFIPLANLFLLITPPEEKPKLESLQVAKSIGLVFLGFLMMVTGRGLSQWSERLVDRAAQTAQNDVQLQNKVIQYEVQNKGLEALLKQAANAVQVPTKLDAITTLKAVEADRETLRYVYEVSSGEARFSQDWHDIITNKWCKSSNFKPMIDIGATIEGKYVSQEGQKVAELKVSTALCDQWRSELQKNMQDAAKAIKGPIKLDEITTLIGADYKDNTFSYHYMLDVIPTDDTWKENLKNSWCQAAQFKSLMAYDLTIRGAYTTKTNAPLGEVLINSAICSASALK